MTTLTRNSKDLHGKLLVITGGGSGIGRETALAFARCGAEVVLSDINVDAAKETAAMIDEAGGTAHAYQLDVADEAAVHAHAEEVAEKHGVPDILINNAGIGQAGPFLETPSKAFNRVMDINFYGVVNGCRAFGAKMVERGSGGHIVNLASMAAYSPLQSFTAYSTSKAAVFMFSDCLRAELARYGIGVSTICPGIVHTNIIATHSILRRQREHRNRQATEVRSVVREAALHTRQGGRAHRGGGGEEEVDRAGHARGSRGVSRAAVGARTRTLACRAQRHHPVATGD